MSRYIGNLDPFHVPEGRPMSSRLLRICIGVLAAWLLLDRTAERVVAQDERTATLRIRFKVHGGVPKQRMINPPGVLPPIPDESLVVNPLNGGVQNVFFYVQTGRTGTKLPPVPPTQKTVRVDIQNGRLNQHAFIMQAGDKLQMRNKDPSGYNLSFAFFKNPAATILLQGNAPATLTIKQSEPAPTPIRCTVKPWVSASVLVLDHPYAAVSDEDGFCEIKGLPVGKEIIFRANHETLSFSNVIISGLPQVWKRNRFEATLTPGLNDFGVVELPWNRR
ncbi:MAG: methylamine utilization protein [Planctomycetota bacterium]